MKHGKKYNDSAKLIETGKFYDTEEAVAVAVKTGTAKFIPAKQTTTAIRE